MRHALEQTIREELDRSVDGLDSATVSRLAAARNAASAMQPARRGPRLAWGGAGLAAAALVLFLIFLPGPSPEQRYIADMELLENDDFFEMMDQDAEMYQLLMEQPDLPAQENGALHLTGSDHA